MASPGQNQGLRGYVMSGFDSHVYCSRYRDKGKGDDLCVKKNLKAVCKDYDMLIQQKK